jgi:hypothetical protein
MSITDMAEPHSTFEQDKKALEWVNIVISNAKAYILAWLY